eukprot:scaffold1395_cov152-Amphora_coffeaeformis.AAC.6
MTQQQKASSTAWAEARKEFGEAVASALQDLLRQGFSRERATSVIFQQIGGEHDKPSDEQVSPSSGDYQYCCKYWSGCTHAAMCCRSGEHG